MDVQLAFFSKKICQEQIYSQFAAIPLFMFIFAYCMCNFSKNEKTVYIFYFST